MQPFFNKRQQPHSNYNRDNMALISDHINLVKSEEHRLLQMHAFCCDCISVLQRRVNHNHTDNRAQIRVGPECLCRGKGDQDLQECICRVAEQIGEYIDRTAGIHGNKSVIDHEIQRVHNSHQETAGNDRRDNGHENISQQFDGPHKYILLLSRRLLGLCLGAGCNACNGYKLVKHLVYSSGAQNNLELAGGLEHAFYPFHIFQRFFVCFAVVGNNKTKPGCAVRCRDNVFASAHKIQNLPGCLLVIHPHSPSPIYEIVFILFL